MKCAWCDAEQVGDLLEVEAAKYRTVTKVDPQTGEKLRAEECVQLPIQVPACQTHRRVVLRDDPVIADLRRKKAKDVEQITVYDLLDQPDPKAKRPSMYDPKAA